MSDDLPIPISDECMWTTARMATRCVECEMEIEITDTVLRNTITGEIYCQDCGEGMYC